MLNRLIGFLVLLVSFGGAWLWMDYQRVLDEPMNLPEQGLVYELRPGGSLGELANEFQRQGYLESAWYLRLHARLAGRSRAIKAGEYAIAPNTTPRELLSLLVSGRVLYHQLTLVEGWNYRQVLAAVAAHKALKHTLEGLGEAEILKRLALNGVHPEGQFFPDTYQFPRGTTDVAFLQRARERMQTTLQELWPKRAQNLPFKDPYEALILASIVEKETAQPEERPAIAGVFVRRLEKGMKLQTDPTVIYGMGERYDGDIRYRDLREDTPYNTYVHKGLTPTPICIPGREAIEAVLHPADGKALYFVARGDGYHVFSATLKEHNAAVRRYQLKRGN